MLSPADLFELEGVAFPELFQVEFAWEVLGQKLKDHLSSFDTGVHGDVHSDATIMSDQVYIGSGTVVEPGAVIKGPVWIGENATIRSHAYVREYTVVMDNAIVGHCTETKGSVLLPGAQAPHFNYVGDSVLGRKVNLGAGTILSNLKNINERIHLAIDGKDYDTGLRKFGALLGDGTKTGCNSVLNPGCVMGKNCIVYPNTSVKKGYFGPGTIVKLRQTQELGELRGQ